jgi:hypothetical protein
MRQGQAARPEGANVTHILVNYGEAAAFGYLVCFCVFLAEAVLSLALRRWWS